MKKITFLLVVILMAIVGETFAQGVVTGTVFDAESNAPLPGANILEARTSNGTTTDFDGKFSIKVNNPTGTINISYVGFKSKNITFDVTNGNQDLGTISLDLDNSLEEIVIVGSGIVDLAEDRKTPIAVSTVKGEDIQLKAAGNVEFTETIKNTPSVYVSNQAGGFGDSQIFLRGFDNTNTAILLNGQPINSPEDGRVYWSNWAGMSDVANAVQVQRGLGSSKLAISSVGGTINIISKSTDQKEGGFVRLLGGNDSYAKGTISYNTGLSNKGWAFSVLVDHWQAHRKYSEGTAGQGQNYLFSVGYKPNEKNTFNFLITGAPQWHDQNFSQNLEVYDEFGSKQNRNSGFLDGERFTERRNYYHKPVANLNWDFDINEILDLSTVLYASWGRGGGTGGLGRGRVRVNNNNNDNIDFEQIRMNNIASANNGIGNNSDSYLRRSSVNNHNWYGLLSNLNIELEKNWAFNVGFDGRLYRGDHFYQINDLLGLTGYNDNYRNDRPDDYLINTEFEANPWSALFDYADEADRLQFDYSENINYLGGFGQAEYSTDKFATFVQAAISTQSYQRDGRFSGTENGLGKSEKLNKIGYNVKGGVSYNITEEHSIFANTGFFSRQPFLDNIFVDIRNSNNIVDPEVDNEEITSFEAGYRFKNNNFRLNIDVYQTEWANRFLTFNGPELQPSGDYTTFRLTNIAQIHKGLEFDLEYRPDGGRWKLKGYGSLGNWKFDGKTPFTLTNDQTTSIIGNGEIDLTETKVGNAPQTSFGAGIYVDILDNLSFDADYNVYTDLYGFVDPEDVFNARQNGEVYQAPRLPSYDLVDAGITYKFNLGENKFTFRGNVKNVFNSPYINQLDSFGYFLGIGRTWNASLRYNF
ncbi:TonB-dependent receptor domain-containing protein [Aquimarina muelleri]|uniref:TonB-dependent receptor n=1 Tax=Aquimarina muelleri TaxID=279356 RepID=UPI003F68229F